MEVRDGNTYGERTNGISRGSVSNKNSLNGVNSGLNVAEKKSVELRVAIETI